MAKKRSSLATNATDRKHQRNAKKKARRNAGSAKPICPRCGSTTCFHNDRKIDPDDPRWFKLIAQQSPGRSFRAAPSRSAQLRELHKRRKTESFDAPEWAQRVARSSYWTLPEGSIPELTYLGKSPRCSTKAGKRKNIESHLFRVESPPLPFDEETVFLWHGTAVDRAEKIVRSQLRPSSDGMLGPGIYLGKLAKARNYVRENNDGWGVLLYVEAALGRVGNASEVSNFYAHRYDTLHTSAGKFTRAWGGRVRYQEWCVRDPARVRIVEIHIVPAGKFR